jgi:aquaporin Z
MNRGAWRTWAWEALGTGLLVLVGLSFVILDFAPGSPVVRALPAPALRRLVTGFLFGSTGAAIAVSQVGRRTGAHINPAVTLAFWLRGKMEGGLAAGYVVAQLVGGILGALPLMLWGGLGRAASFGATVPGPGYGPWLALVGETATTFCLVFGLFAFLGHERLRRFTPALFPVLYAVMVLVEAPVSGTSTNPARTLGPAVVANLWRGWWVYWLGPALGAALGVAAHHVGALRRLEFEVAKVYHFDLDPHGVFRPGSPEG